MACHVREPCPGYTEGGLNMMFAQIELHSLEAEK
jgi:hypothetical protein